MSGISIVADSGTQFENGAAQRNSICKLDSNTFAIAFQDNNDGNKGKILIGTRTGTSISINFANAATFYSNSTDSIVIVPMSSTKVAIAFRDINAPLAYLVICTISGTTVTVGTPVNIDGSGANGETSVSVAVLDSSNLVWSRQSGNAIYSYVCSVSGTTPSAGSSQAVNTAGFAFQIASVGLDSTHFVIAFTYSSGTIIKFKAGTVNTGAQTISFGSEVQSAQNASQIVPLPIISAFDNEHFIVGFNYLGGGNSDLYLQVGEVNLSTDAITLGGLINTGTGTSAQSDYSLCTIGASNALIAYYTTTGTQCEMRGITLTGATTIAFDAQGPVVVDNNTSSYTALCALTSTDFIIGLKEG